MIRSIRNKWEIFLAGAVALLNFAVIVQGISWGLPAFWYLDEIAIHVVNSLRDGGIPYNPPFYPNLDLYFMFVAGKVLYWFLDLSGVMLALRLISAAVSSGTLVLVYMLSRNCGAGKVASILGMLFCGLCTGFFTVNHLAHNDPYVIFFMTASLAALQRYATGGVKRWFYIAAVLCGCAAGCKYNGAFIAPVFLYVLWRVQQEGWKSRCRTALAGAAIFTLILLFSIPRIFTHPVYFFEFNTRNFFQGYTSGAEGWGAGNPIGIIGQWGPFMATTGVPLFLLFTAAVVWYCVIQVRYARATVGRPEWILPKRLSVTIAAIAVLMIELPIAITHLPLTRYFVPLLPSCAALGAVFVTEAWRFLGRARAAPVFRGLFALALAAICAWSALRIAAGVLVFVNDSRIPAERFLRDGIPAGSTVEYLLWPPRIPGDRLKPVWYPFVHRIFVRDSIPPGTNIGCTGLAARASDYFILDSFTYAESCLPESKGRLLHDADCSCWNGLLAGNGGYFLVKKFAYLPPGWMPRVRLEYVNPTIWIFKRRQ
jgi:hypothetical protein